MDRWRGMVAQRNKLGVSGKRVELYPSVITQIRPVVISAKAAS
jgi:hypothetical protein